MLGDQQHLKYSKARVVHPDVYILPSKEDPIYHLYRVISAYSVLSDRNFTDLEDL